MKLLKNAGNDRVIDHLKPWPIMTEAHFKSLYANTPYRYFLYDSAVLSDVRTFALSGTIEIMVMTVQAINKSGDEAEAEAEAKDAVKAKEKSKNVIYRASEKTSGEKAEDLLDEPNGPQLTAAMI